MGVRIYLVVFAVLVGSTIGELALISFRLSPPVLVGSLLGAAGVKAVLIALFFQHLKDEPKPLSSLLILALVAAFLLTTLSFLQFHPIRL